MVTETTVLPQPDWTMRRLSILGAGAWGTALAIHFSACFDTVLWSPESKQVDDMISSRMNQAFFPNFHLPENLYVTDSLEEALEADVLIIALPTVALEGFFNELKGKVSQPVILACKGFVALSNAAPLLPFQYANQCLGEHIPVGILSGPSFAQELAASKPTAVVLAFEQETWATLLAQTLHTSSFRIYSSTDRIGVSVGGAVKNALAIATGICDGMQLGANARAALITRGLAETMRFGVAIGAKAETFAGLAGMGDLILTTTGDLSRNRQVGLWLAQGQSLDHILSTLGHVAEGVGTARILARWSEEIGIEMPLCSGVNDILEGRATPTAILDQLLNRDPKAEC